MSSTELTRKSRRGLDIISTFPFHYLGCPIYTGKKKNSLFTDLATKVINKSSGWQNNFLSPGGKALIIKHILQSQTLHTFAALEPTKTILYQIDDYFSIFLGERETVRTNIIGLHGNICYPTEERGLSFKRL